MQIESVTFTTEVPEKARRQGSPVMAAIEPQLAELAERTANARENGGKTPAIVVSIPGAAKYAQNYLSRQLKARGHDVLVRKGEADTFYITLK